MRQCISISNKNCINGIHDVRIFQTLSKYQRLADYNGYDVALFQVPPHLYGKIMIYDGLKVKIPEDQCFVIRDTYTYETKAYKNIKTVPVITLDYKYKPKDKKKNTANKSKQKKKVGKKKQK